MNSIIIPTVNRASLLELAIESFCQQDFAADGYEILVVDNGSTDSTKDVTSAAIAAYPDRQIRYIYEPEPGLLSGRHRGAVEAKGEVLIFVDDDIAADRAWLGSIVGTFADPTVQLVGGKNLPTYEVETPTWLEGFWETTPYGGRACSYLSLLDLGDRPIDIDANYVWGLNFSIRKHILFELGGFHPDCIPARLQHFQGDGETGLTQKANQKGYRAVYQPQALVHHRISKDRLTPEYFQKRAYYQGVCNSYTTIRKQAPHFELQIPTHGWRASIDRPLNYARSVLRQIRNLGRSQDMAIEQVELAKIKQQIQAAYQNGYTFHQHNVRQQPELLDWVLKDDYWDYRLPQLNGKQTHIRSRYQS
jgi:glucosyl-dolichyl phosphate glucuronosyltransferase